MASLHLKSMSEELKTYCLKCKEQRVLLQPQPEWSAAGRPGTRGQCPVCGGALYRQGRTPAHDTLPKPESAPSINGRKAPTPARPAKQAADQKSAQVAGRKSPRASKAEGKTQGGQRAAARTQRTRPASRQDGSAARSGRLVVVESPAKAKTIGKYLGRGYIVKSSIGHVRDLLKSRLSVDVEHGYEPEYRVPNEKRKVVQELKEAAGRAREIYLATDPDREGEAIAWHVLEAAEMDPTRTRRVVFQEITQSAVKAAFENPRAIDMHRVHAQQARRILDRLVGYQLSPLLWRKVRGRLSAGRVQSVAVRLVVEREREIEAFDPQEYWTIHANLSQEKFRAQRSRPVFKARLHRFGGEEPDLTSEEKVRPHVATLQQAAWGVGHVRLGQRQRRPQAPFTTSTLQQEASRRLNFDTGKTMRLAQQLYEGVDLGQAGTVGLITYMRTDSVQVAQEAQAQARAYIGASYGPDYLPERPPFYKTRSKTAQEAHEAIRPTAVERIPQAMKAHLRPDQFRLYQLIWARFVASQMAPAVYDTVTADIYAGDAQTPVTRRPYLFRATGSTLRFPGFLALYEETAPSDRPDDGENQVPADLVAEERLDLIALLPEQHFTQPPPRYSEATLVKELEENGIGRPSTYASIISTILDRGYVAREEKRLVPTEIGGLVTDLLVAHFPDVLSVDFTAQLEDHLDEIADGKPWTPVVDEFYQAFARQLAVADQAIGKITVARPEVEPVGRDCPQCGRPLIYRDGRFGRFIGCSNFPTCRYTEQIVVPTGVTCPVSGSDLIVKRTRRGRTFYGCARYPECQWTSWYKPVKTDGQDAIYVENNRKQVTSTVCGLRQVAAEAAGVQKDGS